MNSLLQAFTLTRQSARMILWIYAINVLLSLLILLPAYTTLGGEMGHSTAFTNLLDGFDYTVFSDFMETSGNAISPILSVGRWLGVLWVFVSVFLSGGILLRFSEAGEPLNASSFLAGCVQCVKRFFGLLGVVTLFVVVLVVITVLIGTLVGAGLYNSVTEQTLFNLGLGTTALTLLIGSLVLCIGDYAKVILFRTDDRNAFRAFGRAGRLVLANPGLTFGPYLVLILIGTAFFGLYFLIDSLITMRNWPTILILFVVQQALIVARIFLKVWALGTAYTNSVLLIKSIVIQPAVILNPFTEPLGSIETDSSTATASAVD